MATRKTKIHPLLRLALAVVVWWVVPKLVHYGMGFTYELLGEFSTLATMICSMVTDLGLLLGMRYLVFFTKVRFRDTTLRMIVAVFILVAVQSLVSYAFLNWGLLNIVMLFPSNSVAVATALYAATLVLGMLSWVLCASSAKKKSGYLGPILLGVVLSMLELRVQYESVYVLEMGIAHSVDPRWTQLLGWLSSGMSLLGLIVSQWCILYKGQLDNRFGGRLDYDHGTVGNAGGSSIPETDLTHEFEASMREGGGVSRIADLLRNASRHFE